MDKFITDTEKEFDEQFVNKTYPFLGGQRNFWKGGSQDEMKQIDELKQFLKSKLQEAYELSIKECAKRSFHLSGEIRGLWEKELIEKIEAINTDGGGNGRRIKEEIFNIIKEN